MFMRSTKKKLAKINFCELSCDDANSKAESEGFEPPVPRRVQQISSLPRSTTLATFHLCLKVVQSYNFLLHGQHAAD